MHSSLSRWNFWCKFGFTNGILTVAFLGVIGFRPVPLFWSSISMDAERLPAMQQLLGGLDNLLLPLSATEYISPSCILQYIDDGSVRTIPDSAENVAELSFTAALGKPVKESNVVSFDATYDGGPLKRAEWIKYMSTFLNAEDMAEEIYNYAKSLNTMKQLQVHKSEDITQTDSVRLYRTNAHQSFHSDYTDIVGLLCLARAEEGGESEVASVHHVWNILQSERPYVAELLTKPIWYFDRKGEASAGEERWVRLSVFYLETPTSDGKEQRVFCKWDPYFVRSLTRFRDAGLIPPLSLEQLEAIEVLEETCNRVKLHMTLKVGDIQFLSDPQILHARTAYRDYGREGGMPRRHLMRLWLATPEDEGGWRLPFKDTNEKKRGGVQVDDTRPVVRLDAD